MKISEHLLDQKGKFYRVLQFRSGGRGKPEGKSKQERLFGVPVKRDEKNRCKQLSFASHARSGDKYFISNYFAIIYFLAQSALEHAHKVEHHDDDETHHEAQ